MGEWPRDVYDQTHRGQEVTAETKVGTNSGRACAGAQTNPQVYVAIEAAIHAVSSRRTWVHPAQICTRWRSISHDRETSEHAGNRTEAESHATILRAPTSRRTTSLISAGNSNRTFSSR
jgi:hypothetical protein